MDLKGINGKNTSVMTAWIVDNVTNETRLASVYVKMKKGGDKNRN